MSTTNAVGPGSAAATARVCSSFDEQYSAPASDSEGIDQPATPAASALSG